MFQGDDGRDGVEYAIDEKKRRVDILAVDKAKNLVVIELKVSRGHEKTIGQSLYYRSKVKERLGALRVRIIIIANKITPELRAASTDVPDVELFEYSLFVKVKKV